MYLSPQLTTDTFLFSLFVANVAPNGIDSRMANFCMTLKSVPSFIRVVDTNWTKSKDI